MADRSVCSRVAGRRGVWPLRESGRGGPTGADHHRAARDAGGGRPGPHARPRRLHHRPGHRDAAQHRHRPQPCRRPAHGRAFRGGPDRQGRRPARRDRSAALRGAADPGRGAAGARPGAAGERARSTSRAIEALAKTDAIPEQQLDTQEPLVRQYEGAVEIDQARSTTPRCSSPTAASPRRSAGASGCGWSTRATSCTRPTRAASS